MQQVTNLSNEADQITNIVLDDGSVLQLELLWRGAIERWMLNVTHPDLTVNLINLCTGANILRPWINLVPFGLGVVSTDGQDPAFLTDFSSGRITLYVLSASEVQSVESSVYGPVAA